MLTIKQAADLLGISVALMYALCAAKQIAHERHGLGRGTIRIAPEAIEEYRQSRTVKAAGSVSKPPAARVKLKHFRV